MFLGKFYSFFYPPSPCTKKKKPMGLLIVPINLGEADILELYCLPSEDDAISLLFASSSFAVLASHKELSGDFRFLYPRGHSYSATLCVWHYR